ncbi:MAG: sodium:solute symporter family protein [Nocardioides sp.]
MEEMALVPFIGVLLWGTVVSTFAIGQRKTESAEFLEWSIAGRSYGPWMTWFLLGGSIFTAYTLLAVPARVYTAGAFGFFALPYLITIIMLTVVVLPWLWRVCTARGWLTPADIARDRFDSRWVGLAVSVTCILATLPYIALQLLGLSSLLTVMGIPSRGLAADVALTVTFLVLAVGTFQHGMRAPAGVAVLKSIVSFAVAALLAITVIRLGGGLPTLFGDIDRGEPAPGFTLLLPEGSAVAYTTLAVGSALALLLYPHILLPTLAAKSERVVQRVAPYLLAWVGLLGVLALLSLSIRTFGVQLDPDRTYLALPALIWALFDPASSGVLLGALGIGALVPAAVMSLACAVTFATNIYAEFINPAAEPEQVTKVAKWVSALIKVGALLFVVVLRNQDAVTLQLLANLWILQTLPAVWLGLKWQWPHRVGVLAGLCVGMIVGTALVVANDFGATTTLQIAGYQAPVYSGLVALAANLVTMIVVTVVADALRMPRGVQYGTPGRWLNAPATGSRS